MSAPLLELDNITKLYPGTIALREASLRVERGEVHGIIGKNGAGQDDARRQNHQRDRDAQLGRARRAGDDPQGLDPRGGDGQRHYRVDAGAAADHFRFTVAENLFTPTTPAPGWAWPVADAGAGRAGARRGGHRSPGPGAGKRSHGERAAARARGQGFLRHSSDIVLLDEVTASLSEKDEALLDSLIAGQKRKGKAILYITHRMAEIMRLCDRVSVLRDGRIVATDGYPTYEARCPPASPAARCRGRGGRTPPRFAARVRRRSSGSRACRGPGSSTRVSFDLREGEILGLAGLRGCGRTEIMKALAGILRRRRGAWSSTAGRSGLSGPTPLCGRASSTCPEDRDREGLVETHGVRLNLSLSSLGAILAGPFSTAAASARAARADRLPRASRLRRPSRRSGT